MEIKDIIVLALSSTSLLVSLLTFLINKKEFPKFMPMDSQLLQLKGKQQITLIIKNIGEKAIHELTVLGLLFDINLSEISTLKHEEKFGFPIASSSEFKHLFNAPESDFYIRIRFKGNYSTGIPWIRLSFEQIIWYKFEAVEGKEKKIINYSSSNLFTKQMKDLESKYSASFQSYQKSIDSGVGKI